jgi:hypothetical protein
LSETADGKVKGYRSSQWIPGLCFLLLRTAKMKTPDGCALGTCSDPLLPFFPYCLIFVVMSLIKNPNIINTNVNYSAKCPILLPNPLSPFLVFSPPIESHLLIPFGMGDDEVKRQQSFPGLRHRNNGSS